MSNKKEYEKAYKALENARNDVYKAGYPSRNIPLSQCLQMASESVRDVYNEAQYKLEQVERDAIKAGKAWRNSIGLICFY